MSSQRTATSFDEDFVFIEASDAADAAFGFESEAENVLAPNEWPVLPNSSWDFTTEWEQRDGAPPVGALNAGKAPSFAAALASAPLSSSPPDAAPIHSLMPRPIGPPRHRHITSAVQEAQRRDAARNKPRRERTNAPRWDEAGYLYE